MLRHRHHHYNWAIAFILIKYVIGFKIMAPSSPHFPSSIFSTTHRPTSSGSSSAGDGLNLPKIRLVNSTKDFDDPYYTGIVQDPQLDILLFQNETMYIVPSSRLNLIFECEANYPVFWNLGHSKIHPSAYHSLRVLSIRKFEDAFDPSTFSYVTTLTMNGPLTFLTGEYSCQSSAKHEIQKNIQVYWQSSGTDVFVHSKENLTITISAKDDIVELPCQITNPEALPKLRKETGLPHNPYQDMGLNDSVQYSPTAGYTLKNLPNPVGIYKCLLDGNDFVSIRVVRQNVTENPEKNYSFKYDDENKRVECCSKGKKKPPKIYWLVCEHPSTCGFREHFAPNTVSYLWQQGRRHGNCTVFSLKSYHTGLIRCVGENFNVFKEFIAPVQSKAIPWNQKRNTTTYFRWEEIDPQEMITIQPSNIYGGDLYYDELELDSIAGRRHKTPTTSIVYSNQVVHLSCHTSRYYFAEGTQWMVRWKNKTMTSSEDIVITKANKRARYNVYYGGISQHSDSFDFVASTEMESVICFAPVWNSSVWVTKLHYLYVNETISPWIVEEKEIVKYTWYANDTGKELSCSGSGIPSPTFRWEKDNMTIHDTAHNYHVFVPNITGPGEMEIVGGGSANNNSESGSGSNDASSGNSTFPKNRSSTTITKAAPTAHSSLQILRVSYSTHGVFRCVATNFGGVATKEFHITVLEPKSWTSLGVFAGASVITVVLMTAIIYLLRKLHKDRQEIRQLASVNFKDVTRSTAVRDEGASIGATGGSAPAPDVYEYDDDIGFGFGSNNLSHGVGVVFDNGKMTNNLIDTF